MKLKKSTQIAVSMVALCMVLYEAMQYELAQFIISAVCIAVVGAVIVVKYNGWIFGEKDTRDEYEEPIYTTSTYTSAPVRWTPELFDYEKENAEETRDCESCDEATCDGCSLLETAGAPSEDTTDYDVDEIIKEFTERAEELKQTKFDLEEC